MKLLSHSVSIGALGKPEEYVRIAWLVQMEEQDLSPKMWEKGDFRTIEVNTNLRRQATQYTGPYLNIHMQGSGTNTFPYYLSLRGGYAEPKTPRDREKLEVANKVAEYLKTLDIHLPGWLDEHFFPPNPGAERLR